MNALEGWKETKTKLNELLEERAQLSSRIEKLQMEQAELQKCLIKKFGGLTIELSENGAPTKEMMINFQIDNQFVDLYFHQVHHLINQLKEWISYSN